MIRIDTIAPILQLFNIIALWNFRTLIQILLIIRNVSANLLLTECKISVAVKILHIAPNIIM